MRRSLVLLLVIALVGGAFGAQASAGKKKKKAKRVERQVEQSYEASLGSRPGVSPFWIGSPLGNITGVEFSRGFDEAFISVKIEDDSGFPTAGTIGADMDGTPETLETIAQFCGETTEPVEIPREAGAIRVLTASGDCDGETGLATSGTVIATFSNLP